MFNTQRTPRTPIPTKSISVRAQQEVATSKLLSAKHAADMHTAIETCTNVDKMTGIAASVPLKFNAKTGEGIRTLLHFFVKMVFFSSAGLSSIIFPLDKAERKRARIIVSSVDERTAFIASVGSTTSSSAPQQLYLEAMRRKMNQLGTPDQPGAVPSSLSQLTSDHFNAVSSVERKGTSRGGNPVAPHGVAERSSVDVVPGTPEYAKTDTRSQPRSERRPKRNPDSVREVQTLHAADVSESGVTGAAESSVERLPPVLRPSKDGKSGEDVKREKQEKEETQQTPRQQLSMPRLRPTSSGKKQSDPKRADTTVTFKDDSSHDDDAKGVDTRSERAKEQDKSKTADSAAGSGATSGGEFASAFSEEEDSGYTTPVHSDKTAEKTSPESYSSRASGTRTGATLTPILRRRTDDVSRGGNDLDYRSSDYSDASFDENDYRLHVKNAKNEHSSSSDEDVPLMEQRLNALDYSTVKVHNRDKEHLLNHYDSDTFGAINVAMMALLSKLCSTPAELSDLEFKLGHYVAILKHLRKAEDETMVLRQKADVNKLNKLKPKNGEHFLTYVLRAHSLYTNLELKYDRSENAMGLQPFANKVAFDVMEQNYDLVLRLCAQDKVFVNSDNEFDTLGFLNYLAAMEKVKSFSKMTKDEAEDSHDPRKALVVAQFRPQQDSLKKEECKNYLAGKPCADGANCKYKHVKPRDSKLTNDNCFKFEKYGTCDTKDCKYKHVQQSTPTRSAQHVQQLTPTRSAQHVQQPTPTRNAQPSRNSGPPQRTDVPGHANRTYPANISRTEQKVCSYFAKGSCPYGEQCHYLHDTTKRFPGDGRGGARQAPGNNERGRERGDRGGRDQERGDRGERDRSRDRSREGRDQGGRHDRSQERGREDDRRQGGGRGGGGRGDGGRGNGGRGGGGRGDGQGDGGRKARRGDGQQKCYICHEYGHLAKNCPSAPMSRADERSRPLPTINCRTCNTRHVEGNCSTSRASTSRPSAMAVRPQVPQVPGADERPLDISHISEGLLRGVHAVGIMTATTVTTPTTTNEVGHTAASAADNEVGHTTAAAADNEVEHTAEAETADKEVGREKEVGHNMTDAVNPLTGTVNVESKLTDELRTAFVKATDVQQALRQEIRMMLMTEPTDRNLRLLLAKLAELNAERRRESNFLAIHHGTGTKHLSLAKDSDAQKRGLADRRKATQLWLEETLVTAISTAEADDDAQCVPTINSKTKDIMLLTDNLGDDVEQLTFYFSPDNHGLAEALLLDRDGSIRAYEDLRSLPVDRQIRATHNKIVTMAREMNPELGMANRDGILCLEATSLPSGSRTLTRRNNLKISVRALYEQTMKRFEKLGFLNAFAWPGYKESITQGSRTQNVPVLFYYPLTVSHMSRLGGPLLSEQYVLEQIALIAATFPMEIILLAHVTLLETVIPNCSIREVIEISLKQFHNLQILEAALALFTDLQPLELKETTYNKLVKLRTLKLTTIEKQREVRATYFLRQAALKAHAEARQPKKVRQDVAMADADDSDYKIGESESDNSESGNSSTASGDQHTDRGGEHAKLQENTDTSMPEEAIHDTSMTAPTLAEAPDDTPTPATTPAAAETAQHPEFDVDVDTAVEVRQPIENRLTNVRRIKPDRLQQLPPQSHEPFAGNDELDEQFAGEEYVDKQQGEEYAEEQQEEETDSYSDEPHDQGTAGQPITLSSDAEGGDEVNLLKIVEGAPIFPTLLSCRTIVPSPLAADKAGDPHVHFAETAPVVHDARTKRRIDRRRGKEPAEEPAEEPQRARAHTPAVTNANMSDDDEPPDEELAARAELWTRQLASLDELNRLDDEHEAAFYVDTKLQSDRWREWRKQHNVTNTSEDVMDVWREWLAHQEHGEFHNWIARRDMRNKHEAHSVWPELQEEETFSDPDSPQTGGDVAGPHLVLRLKPVVSPTTPDVTQARRPRHRRAFSTSSRSDHFESAVSQESSDSMPPLTDSVANTRVTMTEYADDVTFTYNVVRAPFGPSCKPGHAKKVYAAWKQETCTLEKDATFASKKAPRDYLRECYRCGQQGHEARDLACPLLVFNDEPRVKKESSYMSYDGPSYTRPASATLKKRVNCARPMRSPTQLGTTIWPCPVNDCSNWYPRKAVTARHLKHDHTEQERDTCGEPTLRRVSKKSHNAPPRVENKRRSPNIKSLTMTNDSNGRGQQRGKNIPNSKSPELAGDGPRGIFQETLTKSVLIAVLLSTMMVLPEATRSEAAATDDSSSHSASSHPEWYCADPSAEPLLVDNGCHDSLGAIVKYANMLTGAINWLEKPFHYGTAEASSDVSKGILIVATGTLSVELAQGGYWLTHAVFASNVSTSIVSQAPLEAPPLRKSDCDRTRAPHDIIFYELKGESHVPYASACFKEGHYWLNAKVGCDKARVFPNVMSVHSDAATRSLFHWHLRFNHCGKSLIKRLSHPDAGYGIKLTNDTTMGDCESCIKAKAHCRQHGDWGKEQRNLRGTVTVDFWGPAPWPAFGGATYFLLFWWPELGFGSIVGTDGRETDMTLNHIHNMRMFSKAHLDRFVNHLVFDNEGALTSNEAKRYYAEEGVTHRAATAYAHYDGLSANNGIMARILECVRCHILVKNYPAQGWLLVAMHYMMVHNGLPALRFAWKSPIELAQGRKVNFSRLFMLGSTVMVVKPTNPSQHKFEPRAEIGILVGYHDDRWLTCIVHFPNRERGRPTIVHTSQIYRLEENFSMHKEHNAPTRTFTPTSNGNSNDVKFSDADPYAASDVPQLHARGGEHEAEETAHDVLSDDDVEAGPSKPLLPLAELNTLPVTFQGKTVAPKVPLFYPTGQDGVDYSNAVGSTTIDLKLKTPEPSLVPEQLLPNTMSAEERVRQWPATLGLKYLVEDDLEQHEPEIQQTRNDVHGFELFSGLGTVAKIMRTHGLTTTTLDIDGSLKPDITIDFAKLPYSWLANLPTLNGRTKIAVWASPPCTTFTFARHRVRNDQVKPRGKDGYALTEQAKEHDFLVSKLLVFIAKLQTQYGSDNVTFAIENPLGYLVKHPIVAKLKLHVQYTSQCLYGRAAQKHTMIISNVPLTLHPMCNKTIGCAHKDSHSGHVLAQDRLARAAIPDALADTVIEQLLSFLPLAPGEREDAGPSDKNAFKAAEDNGDETTPVAIEKNAALPLDAEHDQYEVDEILSHRVTKGKKQWLVKWTGYDSKHNSWTQDISDDLREAYERKLTKAKAEMTKTKPDTEPAKLRKKLTFASQVTIVDDVDGRTVRTALNDVLRGERGGQKLTSNTSASTEDGDRRITRSQTSIGKINAVQVDSSGTGQIFTCVDEDDEDLELVDTVLYELGPGGVMMVASEPEEATFDLSGREDEGQFHAFTDFGSARTRVDSRIPKSYNEAVRQSNLPGGIQWTGAIAKEIESFVANSAFTNVRVQDIPKDATGRKHKALIMVWVFRLKEDDTPKARACVQGFRQREFIDFFDTTSPVVDAATIKTFLVWNLARSRKMVHADIDTSFLVGKIDCEIYVRVPLGYDSPFGADGVWKLNSSVYGLRQAPLLFFKTIQDHLLKKGYTQSRADPCLFRKLNPPDIDILAFLYVDDFGASVQNDASEAQFFADIGGKDGFKHKNLGVASHLLGVDYTWDLKNKRMFLSQEKYTTNFLERHGYLNCAPCDTPAEPGFTLSATKDLSPLSKEDNKEAISWAMTVIGGLRWIERMTRYELAYCLHEVSKCMSNPGPKVISAIERMCRYVSTTRTYGLCLDASDLQPSLLVASGAANCRHHAPPQPPGTATLPSSAIGGYADSSFAADIDNRKSLGAYCITIGHNVVATKCKLSTTIAQSSTEAEIYAAAHLLRALIWLGMLLTSIGEPQDGRTMTILEDNQAAISWSKSQKLTDLTKHIAVKYHLLKQHVASNSVRMVYVNTDDMVSDLFTKSLTKPKFQRFRAMCGIVSKATFDAGARQCQKAMFWF